MYMSVINVSFIGSITGTTGLSINKLLQTFVHGDQHIIRYSE